MHPRMLARDSGCSGGTCPAVYDDDPDLQPGELAVVGKAAAFGLQRRLADRIADDENVVVIKRAIVADALRPALERVDIAHLQAQFETFSYSAFRLETLQDYQYTAEDEQWAALVKRNRRWGKTHQRVHIVTEPLTAAMQQELTEGYAPNVAAGEDISIIACAPGDWPADVPLVDFWLFDSARLYVMHYEPGGAWSGASRVPIAESIVKACQARDAALHRAVPWRTYIASRPDLQRRVAQ